MRQNVLLILSFLILLSTLGGCGERDGVAVEQTPVERPKAGNEATEKPAFADVDKSVAVNSEYVVPGIRFEPPVDDAVADGWQTEQSANAAGKHLKLIAGRFVAEKESEEQLAETIVDPKISFHPLRPVDIETVFQDAAFSVRREKDAAAGAGNAVVKRGVAEFTAQLASMLSFVSHPSEVKTKVKIVKVDLLDKVLRTSAYMQTWGKSDEGAFQTNATWDCKWTVDGPSVILQELKIRDYVEVVGAKSDNGGPMFVDCTESVLGSTPAFRDQLVPSMDQWLHLIEIQYHINIGGWEGLSLADVNGDGLDDIYVCQPGGLPNRLFVHNEDGTCRDVSAESGTDWLNQSHGSVFGDIDNDGDQDLVVGVHDGLLVMSNDGAGKFTVSSGLILPAAVPYSLTLADYDQDGDLDLFACCYDKRSFVNRERIFAKAIPYHDANNGGRNVLFRNEATAADGEWRFRYVTKEAGLDQNNRRFSYAASWEDYDNDGDLDLYVANDFGRNNLYRNEDGRFADVAKEAGVEDISAGMSITWGDYNNDGWMDIYVSNMFSSAGNRIAFQRKFQSDAGSGTRELFQRHARGNSLFENTKDGGFRDVSVEADVTMGRWAWGSRFIDINSDGWQDLLVCNGFLTQTKADDL